MELLGIKDVSTKRQKDNDTRVWRLPIKYSTHPKFIEVASFATGYVRNQNGGYTNYQLNKRCEGKPEYFQLDNGDYRKFTTRSCVLIPNEIDRLEYLISYCLKNYYIKKANEVTDGKYISKWEHEYKLERVNKPFEVNALQNKLANSVPKWKYDEAIKLGKTTWQSKNVEKIGDLEDKIYDLKSQLDLKCDHYQNLLTEKNDLENKLATIERIARINASYR
jgi:hypothetical protein